MRATRTSWIASTRRARTAFALAACCALGGCHSLRFGEALSDRATTAPPPIRTALGGPEIVPASAQELPQPRLAAQPEIHVQLIDLAGAFERAGIANPLVAFAEETVRIRLAEQLQARALLFPTLNAGTNVRIHRGNLLSSTGIIRDSNLQSMYWGFGADAKGTGPVAVPGIRLVSHLADAVYAPQAAREQVVQSRSDANATRQSIFLEVGVGYLALVEAQARLAAFAESQRDFDSIVEITTKFAQFGQGRDADAQRAKSEALLLQAEAERAREEIGIAAAELARLLDLDPADPVRAADLAPPILEMVERDAPLPALLEQAAAMHPEIRARAAQVAVQEIRVRQERARPWFPVVAVGFSAGGYGGSGTDTPSRFGDFSARTDLDVFAVWSLQGLGAGNRAGQNVARANLQIAQVDLARSVASIHEEVVKAHALSAARRQDMDLARRRAESSQQAYQQDMKRARNKLGRPLEVLASARQLSAARQDLVRAIIAYSQAQLQLYAALGAPITASVPR